MQGPLSSELFQVSGAEVYKYSEQPFLLASGRESNHYFNCKKITLNPGRLSLLARAIRDEVIPRIGSDYEFQATGGLTLGADPIAYALSLAYLEKGVIKNPLVVRKEAKDHGTGKQIEGDLDGVREVLLLDDVITTAGSSIKAVQALRKAGLQVSRAVCIIDRQEGGREALAREGVELFSVFTRSDFWDEDRS